LKQVAIESFQWAEELYPILKQFENEEGVSFYKVIAATSDIRNNNGRIYTRKEHEVAAASLSERPLNINHEKTRTLEFPQNQVVAARYEDGHVECIIQVADPRINEMIERGEINHVSVEGVYFDQSNDTKDTEYPTSLHYRALALLTRDDEPGDPQTRIFKESATRTVFEKISIPKVKTLQESTIQEATWSASMVDQLPDSSFAVIQPGGHKDEEGKTVPRSLRHLPYRDANGKPDAAHVRNALARLSQTQVSPQLKAAARTKLVAAAKELGIKTSMDEALQNLKIAYENWHIAEEFRVEILAEMQQVENDRIIHRDAPEAPQGENQQEFSAASAVKPNTQTIPSGTADTTGVKPEMDHPLSMNPLAVTNDESCTRSSRNRPKTVSVVKK
jgi:hypothetical protein